MPFPRHVASPEHSARQARSVDRIECTRLQDAPGLIRGLAAGVLATAVTDLEAFCTHWPRRDRITQATLRDSFRAAVMADHWLTAEDDQAERADRLTFRDVANVLDCDPEILRTAIYRKLPADSLAVIWRAKW